MFVHVVFLSLKKEVAPAGPEVAMVWGILIALGGIALDFGATHWSVSENNDSRAKSFIDDRKIDIVVMGTFPTREAFVDWRNSEHHKRAAESLGKMPVDWLVGDVVPVNLIHS